MTFTAEAEDLENDRLTYRWELSSGEVIETDEPRLKYTFEKIGDYRVSVEVEDNEGLSARTEPISVYAGNSAPVVSIEFEGNRSFYFPDRQVQYSVNIEDIGPDGDPASINTDNLFVSADYIEVSEDMEETEGPEGHLIVTDVLSGKNLVSSLGCRACHHQVESSVGPTYQAIADRYKDDDDAATYLANRIIRGSSGVWGDVAMPAHSDLPEEDAYKIVAWIESLVADNEFVESLPVDGSLDPTLGEDVLNNGLLMVSATYSDEGTEQVKPLSGNATATLRNSRLDVSSARNLQNYNVIEFGGNQLLMIQNESGSFSLNGIHLNDITAIELSAGAQEAMEHGYVVEIALVQPEGDLIGEGVVKPDIRSPQGFSAIWRIFLSIR